MPLSSSPSVLLDSLAIVGVGMMGGSLALAARQRGIARQVIGLGRDQQRLDQAVALGILDAATTMPNALRGVTLIVVCTPVDRIADDVLRIAEHVGPETLITDIGSVKGNICEQLRVPLHDQFIGSHPVAGSELAGFEHSRPDLYVDRLCVVTPTDSTPARLATLVEQFWRELGMRVRELNPDEHDRILALTSHVPHVAAAALAALLTPTSAPFAATGFRDTTRVARGEANLWTAILEDNAGHVIEEIQRLTIQLDAFRNALQQHDTATLRQLLQAGCFGRQLFETNFANSSSEEA